MTVSFIQTLTHKPPKTGESNDNANGYHQVGSLGFILPTFVVGKETSNKKHLHVNPDPKRPYQTETWWSMT